MTLWMEVDLDHNELPVRVCYSPGQLAKEAGVSINTIYASNFRYEKGISKSRYIRVEVDDGDDDDGRISQS